MNHMRLALVTPRYWPQVGEAERFVSNLAYELLTQGARPLVVTARWSCDWPTEVTHRGVPVVRLATSPRGGWSTLHYMRELSRWLRRHRTAFDGVYIANLRHDAYAGIGSMRRQPTPVVCRPRASGVGGDCGWQESARFGRRIRRRCYEADAILAASQCEVDELVSAGYPAARIQRMPYGASTGPAKSSSGRFQARAVLAEVNHDLMASDYAPVAVCLDRFEEQHGLFDLVSAWRPVADRWPSSKLWLIGDGPLRQPLYERIVDLGLHHQILMPGSFDDLEEVFLAADALIAPSRFQCGSPSLMAALMAGLPVVAIATPDNLEMIDDGVQGLLVPAQDRHAMSTAICKLFETPALAARIGDAARQRIEPVHSLDRVAAQHLELFSTLIAARERTPV